MALLDGDINPMMRAESEVVATSAMLANLPLPRCTSEIVAPSAMFTELMMMEPLPRPEKKKPAVIQEAEEPQPSVVPSPVHSPPKITTANVESSSTNAANKTTTLGPAAAVPFSSTSGQGQGQQGGYAPNPYVSATTGQQQASGQPHQAHSATTSQTIRGYPAAPPSAAACAMAQAAQAASAYMMQAPSTGPAPAPMTTTQAPWQYLGQQLTYQPTSRGYTPSYSVPNAQSIQGIRQVYQPLPTTYSRAADGVPQAVAPKLSPHLQAGSAGPSVAGAAGTVTTSVQMGGTTSGGWGSYVGTGVTAPARPSSAQVPAHPYFLPQQQANTAAMLAQTFKLQSMGQQGSQVTVATGAAPQSYVAPMPVPNQQQVMPRTIQVQRVPQPQQQPQAQPQQQQQQHQYYFQAQQLQPPSKSQPLPQAAPSMLQQQQQQPQTHAQQGQLAAKPQQQQIVLQQKPPQVTYGTAPKYTSANFQATGAGHVVQPVRATTLPQALSVQPNSAGFTAIAPQVRTTAPQYLPPGVYAQPMYRTVQAATQQPGQQQHLQQVQVVQAKQPQAYVR